MASRRQGLLKAVIASKRVLAGTISSKRLLAAIQQGVFLPSLAKFFDEAVSASEAINTIEFGKKPSDIVIAAANQPVFDISKTLADLGIASDSPAFAVGKAIADIAQASDQAIIEMGKILENSVTAAEAINTFGFGKVLSDTVTAGDAIDYFALGKALTDTPFVSESHAIALARAISDSATAADLPSIGISRPVSDAVGATDTFTYLVTLGAQPTDALELTDALVIDFAKNISESVTAGETIQLDSVVYLNNGFSASDSPVKSFGKLPTDSVETSDSGSLVNENYWSQDYSPGYVGETTSF